MRQDLTAAMRARAELTTATLRMALAAVQTEQVSGRAARDLDDEDVRAVLRREQKKRREAAEAFAAAGRAELAERERAEAEVLAGYLPAPLSDAELTAVVVAAVHGAGAAGMGPAMKAATAAVAGRAEGSRVAAAVRAALGS